jgi:uncharacterized protein YoaH (UPF0181 family)
MTDLQFQINKLVTQFVSDLTELAQQAAVETIRNTFSDGVNSALTGALAGKHGKRNHSQLDQLQETFRTHVAANPGQRIEQINRALGTSTKDLQLPIRKLIASGKITTKGSRRVTQYFAKKK